MSSTCKLFLHSVVAMEETWGAGVVPLLRRQHAMPRYAQHVKLTAASLPEADDKTFPRVRTLDVSGVPFTEAAVHAACTAFPNVETLRMSAVDRGPKPVSSAGAPMEYMGSTLQGLRPLWSLRSLRSLDISYRVGGQTCAPLIAGLTGLTRLIARGCSVPNMLESVATSLTNLSHLDVSDSRGCVRQRDMLLVAGMTQLRSLDISRCGLSDVGLRHLSTMTGLTRLVIHGQSRLTGQCLASVGALVNLRELLLSAVMVLCADDTSHLMKLTELRKGRILIANADGRGTRAVNVWLGGLTSLKMLGAGAQSIEECAATMSRCRLLTELELFKPPRCTAVAQYPKEECRLPTALRAISVLPGVALTDAGVDMLLGLTGLTRLALANCGVTTCQLARLASGLAGLRDLSVEDGAVSLACLASLRATTRLQVSSCNAASLDWASGLTALRYLDVSNNNQLPNLCPLESLVLLAELRAADCDLGSKDRACLSSLQPLQHLVCLDVARNPGLSLHPLGSAAASLSRIDVRGCGLGVADLFPLSVMPNLYEIKINGMELSRGGLLDALRSSDLLFEFATGTGA